MGLTGYYNEGIYEVEHINLGLWHKIPPTYEIQQTLEYSKILMNGYTYTYDYNSAGGHVERDTDNDTEKVEYKGSGKIDSNMVPSTYQEVGNNIYGAKIYPSDVAYTAAKKDENGNIVDGDGMQMYVVYKITIRNSTTVHVPDVYDELKLYVTSLTNEYDSYKYSIDNTSHVNDSNWEGSEYFKLWNNVDTNIIDNPDEEKNDLYKSYDNYGSVNIDKTTEKYQDRYQLANYDINADHDIEFADENGKRITEEPNNDKEYLRRLSDGIEEGTTNSVYIQFRVTEEFLNDLLAGKGANTSCAVSVAHSVAHHTYTRTDNVWYNTNTIGLEENEGKTTGTPAKYYKDVILNTKLQENKTDDEKTTDENVTKERMAEERNITDAGRDSRDGEGNYYFLHRHLDEYKNTGGLGLLFTLGEQRTISGIVYEDVVTEESKKENANLGNGILDDDEKNRAKGVIVELIDASEEPETNETNKANKYPYVKYPEAKLYQQTGTENTPEGASSKTGNGYKVVDAYAVTDENGYYQFVGVVPGVYKLRFTYSDGTQEMVDATGSKVADITSHDYKSTIMNIDSEKDRNDLYKGAAEFIRNAEESTREEIINATNDYLTAIKDKINYTDLEKNETALSNRQLTEWYKEIYNNNSGIRYNIATDNFIGPTENGEANDEYNSTYTGRYVEEYNRSDFAKNEYRTDYNKSETTIVTKNYINTENTTPMKDVQAVMRSFSPYFSISIENDAADVRNIDENLVLNEGNKNGKNYDYGHRPYYENFNLGLIKTTKTELTLDKIISNIKLTSSSGTVLAQGDPSNTTDYVTALDELKNGESKYARVEMALQELYGTQVETTYRIKLSNISVKDYIEDPMIKDNKPTNEYFGFYFKYGDKGRYGDNNKEDRDIKKQAYLVQATVTQVIDDLDPDYDLLDATVRENVHHPEESRPEGKDRSVETEDQVKVTVDGDKLIFTNWSPIERDADTQIRYKVNGVFREGMDLIYDNAAQITRTKVDYGQVLRTEYKWQEPGTTRLIITPDTGEDRRVLYYIISIIALVIVATGVVIIDRGVLKRKD